MIIFPAIDILGGKCVRLLKGKYDQVTEFSVNPAEVAEGWQKMGSGHIHTVDLDGAREGRLINGETIKNIVQKSGVFVQLGGGIRSVEDIEEALSLGVGRVILGTAAVKNLDFVKDAVLKFGDKIAVGIDAKDGFAAVEGWVSVSKIRALELAKKIEGAGVQTIIYTDIDTDGTLEGPNLAAMEEMSGKTGVRVIASGGVGKMDDIISLKNTGVYGAIVGRALYTGNIDLKEAIKIAD